MKNENIAILKIKKRNSNFHSRFSAKKRLYKYIILNRTSSPVIEKNQVWHVRKKLDLDLMKLGAKKLVGTKDFSTFRASSCNAKSPVRTMDFVKLKSLNVQAGLAINPDTEWEVVNPLWINLISF